MKHFLPPILAPIMALSLAVSLPALAEEDLSQYGQLNPDEMTMAGVLDNVRRGTPSMTDCAAGYLMTKGGRHGPARETFEACAKLGYSQAATWMAYMEQNAFGGEFNPDAAAQWDKQAADAGDPVGMFNYGVSQMRGFGVAQDDAAGRAMIDRAAEAGLPVAQRLQAAGYDLDEITPDADNWRYAPLF